MYFCRVIQKMKYMATTSLKLSSKSDANGRSQVIVKLTISRSNRPCFKSGVFVSPKWFKPVQKTARGNQYGIVVPKLGRLNMGEVKEAEKTKSMLDGYISRLTAVCNALSNKVKINHEVVEEAMNLTKNMISDSISWQVIQDLRKKEEERQQRESESEKGFFDWFDLFLSKKELSEGRKRGYKVLFRMLARYQSFVRETDRERRNFLLNIHTIDRETIEDFFDYAANEKELSEEYPELFRRMLEAYPVELSPKHKLRAIESRGQNILRERKKCLKAFFNWMNMNGYSSNRPFDGVVMGKERYGTPFYLTLEERNIVADFDLSDNKPLEAQRDIFIFQSLIGCRVSDLLKLTADNIVEIDGDLFVEYIPQKTSRSEAKVVSVPLNNRAKRLVEKYRNEGERLFPFISANNYNESIKKILTICGITRNVTILNSVTGKEEQRPINEVASSHMARRGFIGNLYKRVKDPNLIGKLSGHSENSRAFVRYRDIDSQMKKETVSLID